MDYLTKSKHSTDISFDNLASFVNTIQTEFKMDKSIDLRALRDMFLKLTVFGYK